MTVDLRKGDLLTVDDLILIERVRGRFLESCSARWDMSESTSDGMSLVGVIKRLIEKAEHYSAASAAIAPLLRQEEISELDAVRGRHQRRILRTAQSDRDSLLLLVDRLVVRFLALRSEYDSRCADLRERDSKITALESALSIVQAERDHARAEVEEDVGVLRCLRRHRDVAEDSLERFTAALVRLEGDFRTFGDRMYTATAIADELRTVLDSEVT